MPAIKIERKNLNDGLELHLKKDVQSIEMKLAITHIVMIKILELYVLFKDC